MHPIVSISYYYFSFAREYVHTLMVRGDECRANAGFKEEHIHFLDQNASGEIFCFWSRPYWIFVISSKLITAGFVVFTFQSMRYFRLSATHGPLIAALVRMIKEIKSIAMIMGIVSFLYAVCMHTILYPNSSELT